MAAAAAAARQLAASTSVWGAPSGGSSAVPSRISGGGAHGGIPSGRAPPLPPLAKDRSKEEMVASFFSGESHLGYCIFSSATSVKSPLE